MIALIQRTDGVKCEINGDITAETKNKTLLALIGVKNDDTDEDVNYIARKLPELRLFQDENGRINLSANDINASIFIVSQFTLFAKCKKGRRPNFMEAAGSQLGEELYTKLIKKIKESKLNIKTGEFGKDMNLVFNNRGPITIILDSREN